MKKLLNVSYLGSLLLALVIVYLLGAVIRWELNPGEWSTGLRLVAIVVAFYAGDDFYDNVAARLTKRANDRNSKKGDKIDLIKS